MNGYTVEYNEAYGEWWVIWKADGSVESTHETLSEAEAYLADEGEPA